MNRYIKIDKGFQEILDKINFNLSQVEVKGESVLHLFNGRMLLQQLLESQITQEEILSSENLKKKEE